MVTASHVYALHMGTVRKHNSFIVRTASRTSLIAIADLLLILILPVHMRARSNIFTVFVFHFDSEKHNIGMFSWANRSLEMIYD